MVRHAIGEAVWLSVVRPIDRLRIDGPSYVETDAVSIEVGFRLHNRRLSEIPVRLGLRSILRTDDWSPDFDYFLYNLGC